MPDDCRGNASALNKSDMAIRGRLRRPILADLLDVSASIDLSARRCCSAADSGRKADYDSKRKYGTAHYLRPATWDSTRAPNGRARLCVAALPKSVDAISGRKTLHVQRLRPRNGAFAPFLQPTPRSDLWRHDRGRIVSRAETEATRTRGGRSSFRRLVSVDQGHPGILRSLRFRLRCVRKRTSRSGDRRTARRSRVFPHVSSPHPEGTPRKREKGPHDACGSRDSDKGRPGTGVPTPRFARCRTGNRR